MTSKFSIDNRELLQRISSGEAIVGIDFGNLIVRELAAFRLSALDSEPVAENIRIADALEGLLWPNMAIGNKAVIQEAIEALRAYHAQPAPVVQEVDADDNFYSWFGREWRENYQHNQYTTAAKQMLGVMAESAWKAGRRAATLQAGTLTNEDTKQAWTGIPDIDNAINMLDRIDTLESCDDDRIEAVKTVLRGLAGNSPVIPDSSTDMLRRWLTFGRGMQNAGSQLPHNLIAETESMLAAAPQSPGSEPATVPGKWIPVSERMPEVGQEVLCVDQFENYEVALYDTAYIPWPPFFSITTGEFHPTHWMPLPAAPQEARGG